MDKNKQEVILKRIERTIAALIKNNINAICLKNKNELIDYLKENIEENSVVSSGGSVTLTETSVLDLLRSGNYKFLDRYAEGLSQSGRRDVHIKTFNADYYLTSSNAITEDGWLYNVDAGGNRVAAMLFGPKKVYVICGYNKIVKDLNEAILRNQEIAAPANCIRLNQNTPCTKTGKCMDCKSEDRICNEYTLIKRQLDKDRITVIFINEELGY